MLKACKTIKNQYIKNILIRNSSRYIITFADDLERFYKAYKEAGSTDKKNNQEIEKSYQMLKKLSRGNISPKFVDYENYKGSTTSLDDLKGKYVYIDVWATWCGPCRTQIPFLKEIEEKYNNKNIHFLSISVDKKKDRQKWKNMIKNEELRGIQLIADNVEGSQFYKDFYIKGIPRFILLDPQGNIINASAPRPSDKKLIKLFNQLKI